MPLLPRRWHVVPVLGTVLLALLLTAGTACGPGPLLSNVTLSTDVIRPNGSAAEVVTISYRVGQPAHISIHFSDEAGQEYRFRQGEPRAPGEYAASFNGTYSPEEGKPDRRVLPNGRYTYRISAEADDGTTAQAEGTLRVEDADTTPPLVQDVTVLPETFSPNGDSEDDETVINYALTKDAWVTVFVEGQDGSSYLLEPETEKTVRLYALRWDGTAGERLLQDGAYTLHIRARDTAGNVTDHAQPLTLNGGGRPMLEITGVRFFPQGVPVGGTLQVEIKVKNTGESPLRSLGPESGTAYDTIENFNQWKDQQNQPLYYERPGFWRVGVDWQASSRPYPVRWGWGDRLLMPGEEVTITGAIKLVGFTTPYVQFWASVIQEGVGYPGGQVGHKFIAISY